MWQHCVSHVHIVCLYCVKLLHSVQQFCVQFCEKLYNITHMCLAFLRHVYTQCCHIVCNSVHGAQHRGTSSTQYRYSVATLYCVSSQQHTFDTHSVVMWCWCGNTVTTLRPYCAYSVSTLCEKCAKIQSVFAQCVKQM